MGSAALHLSRYLALGNQKWAIGLAGGGFSKIVNSGTGAALRMTIVNLADGLRGGLAL